MACVCWESRISYIDKRGNAGIAPLSYRCAQHRDARRREDKRKADAVARFFLAASSLQRALPAPLPLLAHSEVR